MAEHLEIDPARSALLSMDCQNGIVSIHSALKTRLTRVGNVGNGALARIEDANDASEQGGSTESPPLIQRAAGVLKRARTAGMRVIHVRVGFRPNLPEISGRNALFNAIKNSAQHQRLFQGTIGDIHADVAPEADEVVITKHRVSAFAGTDLAMILRANDIETLFLFGIATSGVVLATLLEAADADYRLVVVKDCCVDLDSEVHACLVDKVFPRYATVISAEEFLAARS
jgi:nicotinamidase-related amidase